MKEIPLTQGQVALVDDADFEAVNAFKWYAQKGRHGFYVYRAIRNSDGSKGTLSLQRFLFPGISRIDHRDGNGLNNQRHNLRPATWTQNGRGFRTKMVGCSSSHRGVCWNTRAEKWQAQINVGEKCCYLGLFLLENDAALAYNIAARKYFGDFAAPNFNPSDE